MITNKHSIRSDATIEEALLRFESGVFERKYEFVLVLVNESGQVEGLLSDGDIRRGLLKGLSINDRAMKVSKRNFQYLIEGEEDFAKLSELKNQGVVIIPVLTASNKLVEILNLEHTKARLPIDAVIMAGGLGKRLLPLTENTPKPMLKIAGKPILEHNVNLLRRFGVKNLVISINYLGDQIRNYFGDNHENDINIAYVKEDQFYGTLGAVALIESFEHDYILVMNSDLLTNIDLNDFFLSFVESKADLGVACISYSTNIPYAVLEVNGKNIVQEFKEKPNYKYYVNGGIYLMKRSLVNLIPKHKMYNATDLMDAILQDDKRSIFSYPILGYWKDIGRLEDYEQAQKDFPHIFS